MSIDDIIQKIEQGGHRKIMFAISDIDGVLRAKTISPDKFREIAASGSVGFCDVIFGWDVNDACYDNTGFTGWHTGYPDHRASLDLTTFREMPWNKDLPYFLADFSNDARGVPPCPRTLMKKITKECRDLGYEAVFAQEFEWFNFAGTSAQPDNTGLMSPRPITSGMFGYSQLRPALYKDYYFELPDLLYKFDIPVESMLTETGPGVYEASIWHDEALAAADKAILFKTAVKEIACRHGITASFMAKWDEHLPGNGGHIHQNLIDKNSRANLFRVDKTEQYPVVDSADGKGQHSDNKDTRGRAHGGRPQYRMNSLMENYLAGQLLCLPEIMPMYAPTINSYKRLRAGTWAPTSATWGYDNRTVAIRVINGYECSTRLEMRVPGADCNPYLAMAASLASGLYGIRNNLKLSTPETMGNAYEKKDNVPLPSTLREATEKMKKSDIARQLFGEAFVKHFTATREWECREFENAVTSWELKRYLEII